MSPINEKRVRWLMEHPDYWEDEEFVDYEFEMDELKDRMRKVGLYNKKTRNNCINLGPLIAKARERMEAEFDIL